MELLDKHNKSDNGEQCWPFPHLRDRHRAPHALSIADIREQSDNKNAVDDGGEHGFLDLFSHNGRSPGAKDTSSLADNGRLGGWRTGGNTGGGRFQPRSRYAVFVPRSAKPFPSVTLRESGLSAHIEPDRFIPGTFQLIVDGTPQSHIDLDDPMHLFFEYVQRMGHVIDLIGEPGQPLTAVHLGAGAMTLPRYIAHTRPGSRQQVVELEERLIDLVREHLPLPRYANVRVRNGDAREVLAKLPSGLRGSVDVVIVDIFRGARTPAHVTSLEFYRAAVELLSSTGIILVNVADGPPLTFARSQVSTLGAATAHVAALAEPQVLKGRRFGNIVLVGTAGELPLEWLPRLLAGGPYPAKVLTGDELRHFTAGAPIVTDATSVPSPPPARSIFQTRTRGSSER